MPRIIIPSILVVCFLFSCKKDNEPITFSSPSFFNLYGGENNQYGRSMVQMGEYLYIAGHAENAETGKDYYLLVLDKFGNKILEKHYLEPGDQEAEHILALGDGNFLISGSSNANQKDIYLIKVNQEGEKIWSSKFSGLGDSFPAHAIETSQGDICVAANTRTTNNSLDIILLWYNKNGTLLRTAIHGGPELDGSAQIEEIQPDEFLLFAYTRSYGASSRDFYLLRINQNGDSLWSKRIDLPDYEESQAMAITQNGNILLCGHSASKSPEHDMIAMKLDKEGNEIWTKHFGGSAHDGGEAMLINSQGNYVFVARSMSYGKGMRDVYWVETNPNGKLIREETLGGEGNDWAFQIMEWDGFYYFVGESNSKTQGDFDVMVAKGAL
jgi:hypothetical protein